MAFVLTPRFAPAYQAQQCNPFGFCAPVSRYPHNYRVARPRMERLQNSTFNHFFSQVDELLGEIQRESQHQEKIEIMEAQREAQRQAHRSRQQRKRALRAHFAVNRTEQGWQIDGEILGFDQDNINIEVTDDYTLKISGNTQGQVESSLESRPQQSPSSAAPAFDELSIEKNHEENTEVIESGIKSSMKTPTANTGAATPDSDTQSHRSYQATVEDNFEDLGAETSSLVSTPRSLSPSESTEPQAKENAIGDTAVATQRQPEAPVQQIDPCREERVHGSFERTFRFPERIEVANISAIFKDGILKISVPRAQVHSRRIAIL
ncbi:hypothetical protein HBH51_223440 [Parastagonospora nodorum]|nr:hypothetical protein HBH51_223440 [Parastagonospora nodorum]KAH4043113.1 hypothetical protein HBH49_239290 [Parastagonospora nodorum]KAH4154815.1 hypothetical protein HBH43_216740 [Parastagonospora nodorum]KAH5297037.1 hypothetical protein HBI11_163230 [Parastagonospora nodorum]